MAYIWFIDTNIIASWIIIDSGLLINLSNKYNYPKEYQKLYNNKYKDDVDFINLLLTTKPEILQNLHEIFVPFLATNELFSAIRDEILSLKLFNKGVPMSKWPVEKNTIAFDNYESDLIYNAIMESQSKLFSGNIEIILDYLSDDENTYWKVSASLLFKIQNTKTQDAMLLTTAIMNEADFFVTRDERLIKCTKGVLKDVYNLEILKPKTAELKFKEFI